MTKLKNMLIAAIAIAALSTNVLAGSFGVGGAGSFANISGTGTETEGTEANTANTGTAKNTVWVGSVFAEYTLDGDHGMTFGIDYIPGSADVNSKNLSRTDLEQSVEGTVTRTNTSVKRTAQATVENHLTYYVELPLTGGLYGKAGYVEMDVITTENIGSTKAYGNTSVDGYMLGVGYKVQTAGAIYYKLEGTHTEFDSLTLSESGQTAGSAQNKVSADLDVTKASFALGYKF